MAKNLNLKDKQELYEKVNSEMVSKRDELKGIELLVDECVEEISSDSSKLLGIMNFIYYLLGLIGLYSVTISLGVLLDTRHRLV